MSIKFEIIEKYKDKNINLPKRATKGSAGYDIEAAEDILIPSYLNELRKENNDFHGYKFIDIKSDNLNKIAQKVNYFQSEAYKDHYYSIDIIKQLIKDNHLRTMVPTGLKVKMPNDVVLKIHPRSGLGSNCFLVLANQTGIIDSDYYNNPDNEGHIFIPILNLSPYNIEIKKGDKIAQGIFEHYLLTDDDEAKDERNGGFGSTDTASINDIPVGETRRVGNTLVKNDPELGMICLPVYYYEKISTNIEQESQILENIDDNILTELSSVEFLNTTDTLAKAIANDLSKELDNRMNKNNK